MGTTVLMASHELISKNKSRFCDKIIFFWNGWQHCERD